MKNYWRNSSRDSCKSPRKAIGRNSWRIFRRNPARFIPSRVSWEEFLEEPWRKSWRGPGMNHWRNPGCITCRVSGEIAERILVKPEIPESCWNGSIKKSREESQEDFRGRNFEKSPVCDPWRNLSRKPWTIEKKSLEESMEQFHEFT